MKSRVRVEKVFCAGDEDSAARWSIDGELIGEDRRIIATEGFNMIQCVWKIIKLGEAGYGKNKNSESNRH